METPCEKFTESSNYYLKLSEFQLFTMIL